VLANNPACQLPFIRGVEKTNRCKKRRSVCFQLFFDASATDRVAMPDWQKPGACAAFTQRAATFTVFEIL
jgi:hypothetical protein